MLGDPNGTTRCARDGCGNLATRSRPMIEVSEPSPGKWTEQPIVVRVCEEHFRAMARARPKTLRGKLGYMRSRLRFVVRGFRYR